MSADLLNWPSVPAADRPRKLFHAGLVTPPLCAELEAKGWQVIDVRLLPNKTDVDRAESLKDWLEGVRLGTIEPDKRVVRFVELECRVYGLAQGKLPSGKRSDTAATEHIPLQDAEITLKSALDFGSDRQFATTPEQRATAAKKKAGRPQKE